MGAFGIGFRARAEFLEEHFEEVEEGAEVLFGMRNRENIAQRSKFLCFLVPGPNSRLSQLEYRLTARILVPFESPRQGYDSLY